MSTTHENEMNAEQAHLRRCNADPSEFTNDELTDLIALFIGVEQLNTEQFEEAQLIGVYEDDCEFNATFARSRCNELNAEMTRRLTGG